MATQVQLRRGTATENDAFTGAQGELTFDTTNKRVRIHDGATAGGFELKTENSSGDTLFADNEKAIFGAGSDLQIYHDGSRSIIQDNGTGNLRIQANNLELNNADNSENYLFAANNGAVTLYYDNAEKISTTSTGVSVTGNATFADNGKAIFGASSDLQIYHDGSGSYVKEGGTGSLYIQGTDVRIQNASGEDILKGTSNGAATLYYDNSAKLATTSTGIDVTGTAVTDGVTVAGNLSVDGGTIKLDGNYPVGTGNVALGDDALRDGSLSGGNNTAIGHYALYANTSGADNTSIGRGNLDANTTGSHNTALGSTALSSSTTGSYNTALGSLALNSNTTASNNTAVGYEASYYNTTASHNVAVGYRAMRQNSVGARNVAIGRHALYSFNPASAVDSYNVAVGYDALTTTNTGQYNTAIGGKALLSNTTASNNTAVGYRALEDNTIGTPNTAVGYVALPNNTTGGGNTALGYITLGENTTGGSNTALGHQALTSNTTASNNTAVGYQAGYSNTAFNNSFFGYKAGYANTTGTSLVAIGEGALDANTTASFNIGIGANSLGANTTGASNTAIGDNTLRANTTASYNIAVGYQALYSYVSGSGENVAVGANALYSQTTGYENIGIGRGAGNNITTGVRNTLIGDEAGSYLTTGSKNTIIGRYNGNQGGLDIRTSSNNIVLSDGDGNPKMYNNGTYWRIASGTTIVQNPSATVHQMQTTNGNDVVHFYNTHGSSPYGLYIGFRSSSPNNTSVYFINGADSTTTRFKVWSNGNVVNQNNSYGAISDVKLKENIVDSGSQWDDIKALTVRKYSMKSDNLDAPNKLGVIAQEVEAAGMNGLVFESADIDPETKEDLGTVTKQVNYSILYMKAVKALQEAMDRIETLEAKVTALENA